MVGRLRPLPEVAVDAARPQAGGQARAHQREIDAKAEAAVEMALAVVPPGESHVVRVQMPVGVDEPGSEHAVQAPAGSKTPPAPTASATER